MEQSKIQKLIDKIFDLINNFQKSFTFNGERKAARQSYGAGYHRSSKKHLKSGHRRSKSGSIFVISDLHLNHGNIIRYCKRPFHNVGIMNKTIIQRWNKVVGPNDTVYFVGDFSFRGPFQYWRKKLQGHIVFIKGNHDRNIRNARHHSILHHRGHSFYIVHNPQDVPENWKDWIIHGHVHSNHMRAYPLVNGDRKSINVSAELTNYYPLNLDTVINWDLAKIKRKESLSSPPKYLS